MIYILLYLMLYYVLVYECELVQMLSARSGVLSFNRLSNHSYAVVLLSFPRFLVICASLSLDSIILRL